MSGFALLAMTAWYWGIATSGYALLAMTAWYRRIATGTSAPAMTMYVPRTDFTTVSIGHIFLKNKKNLVYFV